jgi:hypothetical protein
MNVMLFVMNVMLFDERDAVCDECDAISHDKHMALLHECFPKYVLISNLAVFCSSLISWFPITLLNDFEKILVTSTITGIAVVSTFHMHCIPVVISL